MLRKPLAPHDLGLVLLMLCACPPGDGDESTSSSSGELSGTSSGSTSTASGSASSSSGEDTSASSSSSSGEDTSGSSSGDSTSGDTTTTTTTTDTGSTSGTGDDSTTTTDTGTSSGTGDDSTTTTTTDTGTSSSGTGDDSTTTTTTDTGSTTSTSGDSTTDDSTTTGGGSDCLQQFGLGPDTEDCYTAPIAYGPVPGIGLLLTGDVDLDGHADIIVPGASGGIAVLLGDGAGNLAAPILSPADAPTGAALGEFDGDGKLDLVVSVAGATPRIDLLLGDGLGGFILEDSFPSGPTVGTHLATGDFDNDGDLDAVAIHQGVSNTVRKRLSLITNDGGNAWSYSDQPLTMLIDDIIYNVWTPYLSIGNFDGVHTDVIVSTERSVESPRWLRHDGVGAFTYLGALHGNNFIGSSTVVGVDADGDGDNDVIASDKAGSTFIRYAENLGGGTWGPVVASDVHIMFKQSLTIGALIRDPRPDIIYMGNNGAVEASSVGVDGKIIPPPAPGFIFGSARGFTLADLNEDGWSDYVFVAFTAPHPLSVRLSE